MSCLATALPTSIGNGDPALRLTKQKTNGLKCLKNSITMKVGIGGVLIRGIIFIESVTIFLSKFRAYKQESLLTPAMNNNRVSYKNVYRHPTSFLPIIRFQDSR